MNAHRRVSLERQSDSLFVAVVVQVDGEPIRVELCDTAGEVSDSIIDVFSLKFRLSYEEIKKYI